jgi:hypothetical protein
MSQLTLFILFVVVLASRAMCQLPPIGMIDLFGLRTVPETEVRNALPIRIGDDAIAVLTDADLTRQKLRTLPNIEDASVAVICCDDRNGKSMAFIGIREKGSPALTFRPAPSGDVRLPADVLNAGATFESAFVEAIAARDFSEDDSEGHALFGNQKVRGIQLQFKDLAAKYVDALRNVLRLSSDARHRAIAAQVIAYYENKKAIVPDLTFAMSDPDDRTRNEAMRALLVIAKYSKLHPELKIRVPTIEFVKMLNSLVWTDRNKSSGALDELTAGKPDPLLIKEIRRTSVDSLAEMARWTNPGHAKAAFKILGRVAGLSEGDIAREWESGKRDENVTKMVERIRKRPLSIKRPG